MTHLKPRSTTVTLYQGDDMDRLAHLKRAVDIAERLAQQDGNARAGDESVDENEDVKAARDAFDAFVDDAAGRALSVELHSIGNLNFVNLVAAHPPRRVAVEVEPVLMERALGEDEAQPIPQLPSAPKMVDHDDDAWCGVDTTTFPRALLTFIEADVPDDEEPARTIASPEFPTPTKLARFVDRELAEGDFEQIWITAYHLNRNPSADPKAARYSAASPSGVEI